ncbi:MAG: tRNA uridine-5-carboxymethylaminomethyl(34) synthesis enzyme MnmG [Clostridia bacterium]|nr:tRNA uridine-5-carboxymethylaminomethyl(34) synthesis enzyme MnmG [Clostridia bacterium]
MSEIFNDNFDIIVVGGGHAGCEASLACSRLGAKTLLIVLDKDTVGYMPCNPSIGGTGKGHLVREIDALGGEMGINTDKTMLQIKMLNRGKGAAVQSLRAQSDMYLYHEEMLKTIVNQPNLTLLEDEATDILAENGKVIGVKTKGGKAFSCTAVVLCCGVYLNSITITGDEKRVGGPASFGNASSLTDSLIKLGFDVKRFKTGTPARIKKDSIDYSKFQKEEGDCTILPFSFMNDFYLEEQIPCYLGYTNQNTHDIIRANLDRSPLYAGVIKGVGPRYCPSIEDKVVRFPQRDRHQIFLEPLSATSDLIYVQGMSSSMPKDVQELMYRSIEGFENVEFVHYAYAIEYDCINPLDLTLSLEFKKCEGIFTAGQINGSSGYEEAAAQGLLAGINAVLKWKKLPPLYLTRDNSYIGVLVDDLCTKGTNEPYRMMTARAEHRLNLRQDNADLRLTPIGRKIGLVDDARWNKFTKMQGELERAKMALKKGVSPKVINEYLLEIGETPIDNGSTFENVLKRPKVSAKDLEERFHIFDGLSPLTVERVQTLVKYEGYLAKEELEIEKAKKLDDKLLPLDIDYSQILGLRLEARQKLNKIRPASLGQASRISGVSPADITVLMLYLKG